MDKYSNILLLSEIGIVKNVLNVLTETQKLSRKWFLQT